MTPKAFHMNVIQKMGFFPCEFTCLKGERRGTWPYRKHECGRCRKPANKLKKYLVIIHKIGENQKSIFEKLRSFKVLEKIIMFDKLP
jgi:hypothetical protein